MSLIEPASNAQLNTSGLGPPLGRTAAFRSMADRRRGGALFVAGFATFALLYCVQPLLPLFSAEFGTGAAASSLALSLSTGTLAIAMLAASAVSESVGRRAVMWLSLGASSVLTILVALAPDWPTLLLLRALLGVALSGLPAVAMAYLGEEVPAAALSAVMGLYVAGTAFGGMAGRVLTGLLTEFASWRQAVAAAGLMGLAAAVLVWRTLPASRNFRPRPFGLAQFLRTLGEHLSDRGLPWLFLMGFLVMGSFVTVSNYVGYRLSGPPYNVGPGALGSLFLVYLVGMAASAWAGRLAGRFGRRHVLWPAVLIMLIGIWLTLLPQLAGIVAGVAVMTFGFFASHAVLSSWVGWRADTAKAQASACYLFCYYVGLSVVGTLGGVFWAWVGWPGVIGLVTVTAVLALLIALHLARLPPKRG